MSCLELRFVNFFIKRILYCIVLYEHNKQSENEENNLHA